jgi:hypothetical protein
VPCSHPARGTKDGGVTSPLPFNDVINNDPCGKEILVSINAVATSQTLCLFHYQALNGAIRTLNPIYVFAP